MNTDGDRMAALGSVSQLSKCHSHPTVYSKNNLSSKEMLYRLAVNQTEAPIRAAEQILLIAAFLDP